MYRFMTTLLILFSNRGAFYGSEGADLPVSNLPIYSDGIYFENLKPVKIKESTWTLQTNYELSEFVAELELADKSVGKLLQACKELQKKFPDSCQSLGNIIDLTNELNDFKSLLQELCQQPQESKGRTKRGIWKSWFGLMDSGDRDEIKENFERVDHQMATQSSTVQHFFNSTNEALAVLSGNLFKIDPKKPSTIDYTREGQLLMMDILLNKIIRKKGLFMKLLQSSSSVSLSDDIISPSRLLKELIELDQKLPHYFTFPVSLTLRDVIKMYPLSKVAAYIEDCKMKVKILLPLVNKVNYITLKGTSIPTIEDGILKLYPLENDVLVYNEEQHLGVVMTYEDYKACNHLHDLALCDTNHLVKNLSSAEDCMVVTFFNRTQGDSDCRVSRLKLRHQIWLQLADPNRWIYAVPNRTMVEVNYGLGSRQYLELSGVGMLKLERICHLRSQDIVIQFVPQLRGSVDASFLGFKLPVVVTRDQPLLISTSDDNKVILAGKDTSLALEDRTHPSGIYYEMGGISPWAIIGIVFGIFIGLALLFQAVVVLRKFAQKRNGQEIIDDGSISRSTHNNSQRAFLPSEDPPEASAPPFYNFQR
ncbi:uncharacterized protein LOC129746429 [Uranotaenia lowii]|uniref:uncharacterized protein LOC129746429 n=1 Tax=Uranotaenia lowii TaxID=190385 RepID=UPI002478B9C1|nr:uncharacterized protein LOC129746429 [Uranotaenia lowii]XP_055596054.1 uncharacterized protein LOC129746429 [Uranotaenia lowii]XP_055596055.1 uncharacterized protein LOC129746429 [Uranotaenia lowii]